MIAIDAKRCDLCGSCVAVCPSDSIELNETFLKIDSDSCIECLLCVEMCPFEALASEEA